MTGNRPQPRLPNSVPDNVVCIVTEIGWTLKFDEQGFESE